MTRQKIDLELIKKVKVGDEEAILKIYNYYKNKITKFILKKYPNDDYIEDNVSEILIKVFTNIDKYSKDKSKFNTWVLTIAKNHMLDNFKKSQPIYTNFVSTNAAGINFDNNASCYTLTCSNNSETFTIAEPSTTLEMSPDYNIQASDTFNMVYTNMETCDYTMLTMKVDGYSYNEIGSEFNLTSSEVSNKINYNKKKLTKKIKKEG